MAKHLLIVESPAKAKTIEKILGSDFEVKSCYGHIRDLEKEDMGIDIKNGYKPKYIVSEDKQKVVKELKALAKKSDDVWLATDEDREGEAISWHLCEVLGLDPYKTKRIVFHEKSGLYSAAFCVTTAPRDPLFRRLPRCLSRRYLAQAGPPVVDLDRSSTPGMRQTPSNSAWLNSGLVQQVNFCDANHSIVLVSDLFGSVSTSCSAISL